MLSILYLIYNDRVCADYLTLHNNSLPYSAYISHAYIPPSSSYNVVGREAITSTTETVLQLQYSIREVNDIRGVKNIFCWMIYLRGNFIHGESIEFILRGGVFYLSRMSENSCDRVTHSNLMERASIAHQGLYFSS